jgi:hypothetical protein
MFVSQLTFYQDFGDVSLFFYVLEGFILQLANFKNYQKSS